MRNINRISAIALAALLASAPIAADLKGFLSARKKAKISSVSTVADLGSKTGEQFIEVRGLTKGSMAVDSITKLLIESSSNTLCVLLPDDEGWLATPNTAARLVLKLKREHEFAGWVAEIIEAIPEQAITVWEEKNAPKILTNKVGSRLGTGDRLASAPKATRGSNGRLQAMARNSSDTRTVSQPTQDNANRKNYLQTTLSQWGITEHSTVPAYTEFILNQSKKINAEEARVAAAAIVAFSMEFKLDPRFIVALIICESNFDPGSTSWAGAMGLGQIMPFTRDEMKVQSAYDIISNVYCTVRHFKKYYDRYVNTSNPDGQLTLAIAAYNAGPGNVKKYGGVPPSPKTRSYIQKMLAWYKKLSGQG